MNECGAFTIITHILNVSTKDFENTDVKKDEK